MEPYQAIFASPVGKLGIRTTETHLQQIDFLAGHFLAQGPTTFAAELVCDQLAQYFQDASHLFELPCDMRVTPFQSRVLDQLCQIPAGQTCDYGTIAKRARTAPRAVGMVCRTNPLPIIIPCHRVTAKHHLGGYGGAAQGPLLTTKEWLLRHESNKNFLQFSA